MYCWNSTYYYPIHSPSQMTVKSWGKLLVCVYGDTEVGLCWPHKAVHSGAGCLEQVTLQTAHHLSAFITCFSPKETPPSSYNTIHSFLPFVSLHWHQSLTLDLYKYDYTLSLLFVLNS